MRPEQGGCGEQGDSCNCKNNRMLHGKPLLISEAQLALFLISRTATRECELLHTSLSQKRATHRLCGASSDHDSHWFHRNVEYRRFGIACIAAGIVDSRGRRRRSGRAGSRRCVVTVVRDFRRSLRSFRCGLARNTGSAHRHAGSCRRLANQCRSRAGRSDYFQPAPSV